MHCHSMEMEMEMANSYWVSQVRFFIALLSHLAQGYDKKIYEKVANEKSVVHWGFAPPMFHNEMMSSQVNLRVQTWTPNISLKLGVV